jgi:hypothetical protein
MLSEETKIEVLHAHYVDTFSHIRRALNQRDRLFTYIVIAVTVMLLQIVAPRDTDAALGRLISEKLALSGTLSLSVVGTVLWFALLGLVIRYCQTVIYTERQYAYIHSLEELLAANYGGAAFTREGKSYLSDYPPFSKWTWSLYTIVFPSLLIVVLALKLASEFCREPRLGWLFAFDALTFGAIGVSEALYLLSIHGKR